MKLSLPISASPLQSGRGCPAWWRTAPRIVAESLAAADPLRVRLAAGAAAPPVEVARAIAARLTPAERDVGAPGWLLHGQRRSYRRALAAIDRYGGALLADAVGSGKTYVALAVAEAYHAPAVCLAPAALTLQWRVIADALGVPIEVASHQHASRGTLPHAPKGLVIIDESHHFRNPGTRRYRTVAPWLVGRRVLLLSATPIVNQLEDLAHQLLLGVRDDALLPDGIGSLRAAIARGRSGTALERLVIEESTDAGPRPARSVGASEPSTTEDETACACLMALGRLRLSTHQPTAALIHSVLLRAAASSWPALARALARYRGLLRHAEDARRAGRQLSRAELRAFAGSLDEQMVWWELMPESDGGLLELALDDAGQIAEVLAEVAVLAEGPDLKLERLRSLLADGRPTLVFTTRRETVRHLRRHLTPAVAWCTGDRAGLGHVSAPRGEVMRWFHEPVDERSPGRPPVCLVATDVAAEGLDLRRAERVVHYDLPWTPMRLEQREGRAVRLGSAHRTIEVVQFPPPPSFEAALRLGERLARKARLPRQAGLGKEGGRLWRWRSILADQLGGPGVPGTAFVSGSRWDGALAGFELWAQRGTASGPLAATVGWLDLRGEWTEDSEIVIPRMLEAGEHAELATPPPCATGQVLDHLAVIIRDRLALASGIRWSAAEPGPAARRLVERLGQEIALAVRIRDRRRL
ncbi:MAG: helicase-related protein, partial [Gemmatimonadales bacterium]